MHLQGRRCSQLRRANLGHWKSPFRNTQQYHSNDEMHGAVHAKDTARSYKKPVGKQQVAFTLRKRHLKPQPVPDAKGTQIYMPPTPLPAPGHAASRTKGRG